MVTCFFDPAGQFLELRDVCTCGQSGGGGHKSQFQKPKDKTGTFHLSSSLSVGQHRDWLVLVILEWHPTISSGKSVKHEMNNVRAC